ncbi:hypothetical protein OPU71_07700 [Niveibacterium sp. 24ML]|uniref:hypothetical protein n=1 Tax=Niveibacterium sp. 24ML TaxID=2985512 RepID=UPI00226FD8D8|nr:hypothetical protein [Niveibacterium sp. 24ML]MCX9156009.1 hypothetical protein [Niveibacterium sp. 24ML]
MTISSNGLCALVSALLMAAPGLAHGAEPDEVGIIAVVMRSDGAVRKLVREEVYAIFVLDKRGNLQPLDLPETDPVRAAFYMRLAGKSLGMMRALRSTLVFTGAGRPPKQLELAAVHERLANDPTAIAYLPMPDLPLGVRVVATLAPAP